MMERAFVVDDQASVRKALARLLVSAGFEVAEFGSAQEFLNSGAAEASGCLILDLAMPGINGMGLQDALNASGSVLPIIFLTGKGDIETGVLAMQHGAADFLTKPVDDEKLLAAVSRAMLRNREARLARDEVDSVQRRVATLTPRECEVLALVVMGKLNKQIADVLGTAEKTIKVHRARVMLKMQAGSLAELVRLADQVGIAGPGKRAPIEVIERPYSPRTDQES